MDGVTVKVYGLEFTITGFDEPECTKVHGAVPVSATEIVVLLPLHMVAVPLMTPVGAGFTVTDLLIEVAQLLLAVIFNSTS